MAIPTIESTFLLDVESVRTLETLAKRWRVSKTEVLRRAIRIAATEGRPENDTALSALDRLQNSVRQRQVDASRWVRDLKADRRAAARRLSSKRR